MSLLVLRGEQALDVALQLTHLQTQLLQPEGGPPKYGRMEAADAPIRLISLAASCS